MKQQLPEPLQAFDGLAGAVAPAIQRVDALFAEYQEQRAAGKILPNSVEALRIELTYHSNAIEGSTLSLRETQLCHRRARAHERQDAPRNLRGQEPRPGAAGD
ncbi:MAG: hypothetical protein KF787_01345 [Phycisphaeraceae bacterium]|nr:hypothetical protein [Phycisphaerae bacterium]MBX3391268.1 hypothetical protein [Phycisphaeraceae bacterium]